MKSDLESSIQVSDERVRVVEERHEEHKQRMAERQAAELDKRDIEHDRTLLKFRTELQEQSL